MTGDIKTAFILAHLSNTMLSGACRMGCLSRYRREGIEHPTTQACPLEVSTAFTPSRALAWVLRVLRVMNWRESAVQPCGHDTVVSPAS